MFEYTLSKNYYNSLLTDYFYDFIYFKYQSSVFYKNFLKFNNKTIRNV